MKLIVNLSTPRITRSLPARGVWIEIPEEAEKIIHSKLSLPARGVWIEIKSFVPTFQRLPVTPRKGSVD